MPDEINAAAWSERRLKAIFREWVRSIETAGNLVVMKTPPGSAQQVGAALDQANLPEVIGTICGDDTIFVAAKDGSTARSLAGQLRALE